MASVEQARGSLAFHKPYLDIRDRERAARFRFEEDRIRFVLGRGLLRRCLGHYLEREGMTIELAYTDRGRPVLAGEEEVQFSISHTQDLVAVAVTAGARIGIDLELMRTDLDFNELAKRIFSERDLVAFLALSEREAPGAFFRAWTRKEAYLKARGEGIAERLRDVCVSMRAEEAGLIRDDRDESVAGTWRLFALPVPAGYAASLACEGAGKELECSFIRFHGGEMIREPLPW